MRCGDGARGLRGRGGGAAPPDALCAELPLTSEPRNPKINPFVRALKPTPSHGSL